MWVGVARWDKCLNIQKLIFSEKNFLNTPEWIFSPTYEGCDSCTSYSPQKFFSEITIMHHVSRAESGSHLFGVTVTMWPCWSWFTGNPADLSLWPINQPPGRYFPRRSRCSLAGLKTRDKTDDIVEDLRGYRLKQSSGWKEERYTNGGQTR